MQAFKSRIMIFIAVVILAALPVLGITGALVSSITTILIGGEEEENKVQVNLNQYLPVSTEVEGYRDEILKEAEKYGKEDYIDLFLAVVMQESGGRCDDIFQCSESLGKQPNSITTKASIEQGVKYLSGMLDKASVKSPSDLDNIKLALQGYNFGGGYIDFALEHDGKWTQENVNLYACRSSGGKQRMDANAAINLGGWAYGDQYYTQHVLRYYPLAVSGQGYVEAGEAAKVPLENRMGWLFPNGTPTSENDMQQYLTRINVPIIGADGKETVMTLTVHKKLATEIEEIFKELKEIKFKIRTSDTAAYCWRQMACDESKLSYHSYGSCIDINWKSNGAPYTGWSYNPGKDEFAVSQEVVNIWKAHGFYWGGDWSGNYFDPMHFTYTNN